MKGLAYKVVPSGQVDIGSPSEISLGPATSSSMIVREWHATPSSTMFSTIWAYTSARPACRAYFTRSGFRNDRLAALKHSPPHM